MSGRGRPASWLRALAAPVAIVLPVVSAWLASDAPPGPGEWALVESMQRGAAGPAVLLCSGGPLPEQLPVPGSPDAHALLTGLRSLQLGWWAALSVFTWLVARSALGNPFPLFACALLALLGPVAEGGGILRPEVPAGAFGMLGVLLMQLLPTLRPPRARRFSRTNTMGLVATSSCAIGTAIALVPANATWLLVPGLLLLLVVASLALQLRRVLARHGFSSFPVRAAASRMLPWVLLVVGSMGFAVLLLGATGTKVQPLTAMACTLLPSEAVAAVMVVLFAVLGAVLLLFGVGTSIGRPGHMGPVHPLFACCAVQLIHAALVPRGMDLTSACAPLSLVAAQGAGVPLFATVLLRARRRREQAG